MKDGARVSDWFGGTLKLVTIVLPVLRLLTNCQNRIRLKSQHFMLYRGGGI